MYFKINYKIIIAERFQGISMYFNKFIEILRNYENDLKEIHGI